MKNLIMKNYGLIAFVKFEEIYGLSYKNVIFDLAKITIVSQQNTLSVN